MVMTQKKLAALLKISQMTVSRALANHPHVDEKLRARILKVAGKRGYTREANHAAEVMRRRARGELQSNSILCAMINIPQDSNDDQSFPGRLLKGVCMAAKDLDLEVVLPVCSQGDIPLVVARKQVDGVVRLPSQDDMDENRLACPLPWVSLFFDVKHVDVVTIDNVAGSRTVGRHLAGLGHRRVAFIGPESAIARERLAGLRSALTEVGTEIPDDLVYLHRWAGGEESTKALLEELLTAHPLVPGAARQPFTALVAYNDYMAVAAIRHLHAEGIRIPDDLSVAGFDGAVPRGFRDCRVTTALVPLETIGSEAVRLLSERLKNPKRPRQRLVLGAELSQGQTVRKM